MTSIRIIVCGGRGYSDSACLTDTLNQIHVCTPISFLADGGARGADTLAHAWATCREIPTQRFFAEWDRYGNAAGPVRNAKMLAEVKPDLVVAFPGGRGTADMVAKARHANIDVRQVAG